METDPGECAQCGKLTTMCCAGCTGAPEYEPGDAMTILYCGRDCQTKAWSVHESKCRIMKRRKKLLRAASILQTALLTYRNIWYDYDLTKIEKIGGTLYLYQNERADTARVKRGPFPVHLTTNEHHKQVALTINQGIIALALLSGLAKKLIREFYSPMVATTLEVFDVNLETVPLVPYLLPDGGATQPHTSIKVNMLSPTETWVIDTTGCQYGFRETLVPYGKYMATRDCKLRQDLENESLYTWFETRDLDSWPKSKKSLGESPAQTQDREEERKARLHFANFVKKDVSVDILDGSPAEFKEKVISFRYMLSKHMMGLYIS
ncbi:hypothetical protein FSHL1_009735 [Fusarium sambucinum]